MNKKQMKKIQKKIKNKWWFYFYIVGVLSISLILALLGAIIGYSFFIEYLNNPLLYLMWLVSLLTLQLYIKPKK